MTAAARALLNGIRWTPHAINDLKAISSYIEGQRNLATANRVCRTIYDAIQMLRRFPESGKVGVEKLHPLSGLRGLGSLSRRVPLHTWHKITRQCLRIGFESQKQPDDDDRGISFRKKRCFFAFQVTTRR